MKVKVKDNSRKKKFLHVLDHDVSTTLDYGFCQPIMCRELNAQDTVNLCIPQFVRLGLVVKPTFGRMHLRTYNKFVPIETIYEPWGSFLAGQSFTHGNTSYIPDEVYNFKLMDLWRLVCLHSEFGMFEDISVTNTRGDYLYGGIDEDHFAVPQHWDDVTDVLFPSLAAETYQDLILIMEDVCGCGMQSMTAEFDSPSYSLDYYDWYIPFTKDNKKNLLCGRFTRAGRNLRSILIGCGFQFNLNTADYFSLLPIMAYYKSYFDLFNPNRDLTWKDTNLYKFTEGSMNLSSASRFSSASYFQLNYQNGVTENFLKWFLFDLPQCFYTFNPDFVSAHISGSTLDVAVQAADKEQEEYDGPAFPVLEGNNLSAVGSIGNGYNASLANYSVSAGISNVNRAALRVLDMLSKRINIHTALGTRIKEYLKSVYGSAYLENDVVDDLGKQSFPIDVSDVFSTAETELGSLGQYAGKGVGAVDQDNAEKINFTAPTTGYLVSIICLVPESRYSQGQDLLNTHVTRRQFFDSDFDGITLLPTPQYAVYGIGEHSSVFAQYDNSFGNIPVYSEYKIANNILNGDMSRKSTRNTFLPFTLDRLMPYTMSIKNNSSGYWRLVTMESNVLVNGTVWRYCNLNRWLGNYNRIFLDEGKELPAKSYNFFTDFGYPEDNFIVHNRILLKVHSYALPLSDSFDTGSFEGNTMNVEKA